MNTLARVAATIQERDRQTGEMVALELLITKNNRLGNQETVDLLLDSLQATQKEIKVTDEIIREWFGGTISDLRVLAVELRVSLDHHEEILSNLADVNRTLEILIAGSAFDEDSEKVRDDLLRKREVLLEQKKRSETLLDSRVAGRTKDTPDETADAEPSSEVSIDE